MDRRIALKNMGLSLGYVVATPTLLSLVQSCKTETVLEWTPDFFSQEEGTVITHLVDIILPKTDTPSASEVQVNLFIDQFTDQIMEKPQKEFVKMSLGKFIEKALQDSGKKEAKALLSEDLEPVLASALKFDKAQEMQYREQIGAFMESQASSGNGTITDEAARFAFADSLRGMTILGYRASEYIGEEVLAYDPIPGGYVACDDVETLTQGKAWSLS
ncbi:gluconate 2-dehydrogenase subunit 3 family protein [Spongiimicrobium salis]|uniref:gluconate 2-dehydrogenase subunit 3 family protein n=1 Tax=Spongiimicrobium salis TaxID=1667022 RepID=UPI00374D4BF9